MDTDAPDARHVRRGADGWVECSCGARHWGLRGAAGLLIERDGAIVLQHRAAWSHHGDTWGLPGGALDVDESVVAGALREAQEEAGIAPARVVPRATWVLDHGDWSYTTVLAQATGDINPRPTDEESTDVQWVPGEDVAGYDLIPSFASAWPDLQQMIGRRLVLVVDAANTVGSRPDGWWKDRRAATIRLRDELGELRRFGIPASLVGLPGHTWYPEIRLVTEGVARHIASTPEVTVVAAPADADTQIVVDAEAQSLDVNAHVVAVTADGELRDRLHAVGVTHTIGPRALVERHGGPRHTSIATDSISPDPLDVD